MHISLLIYLHSLYKARCNLCNRKLAIFVSLSTFDLRVVSWLIDLHNVCIYHCLLTYTFLQYLATPLRIGYYLTLFVYLIEYWLALFVYLTVVNLHYTYIHTTKYWLTLCLHQCLYTYLISVHHWMLAYIICIPYSCWLTLYVYPTDLLTLCPAHWVLAYLICLHNCLLTYIVWVKHWVTYIMSTSLSIGLHYLST